MCCVVYGLSALENERLHDLPCCGSFSDNKYHRRQMLRQERKAQELNDLQTGLLDLTESELLASISEIRAGPKG